MTAWLPDPQHLIFAGKQLEERRGECPDMTASPSPNQQRLIFAGKQLEERRGECPDMTA